MLVGVVFGLEYYSPSCRKDAAVDVEFIGFEEEAAEDWQDRQVLPIRQVHDVWSGRHPACPWNGLVSRSGP